MRSFEFLFEKKTETVAPSAGEPDTDPLYSLKLSIAHKIKDLPPSEETKHSLQEVEDIIDSMQLGGRKKATEAGFDGWNDKDVQSAKKMLAKYVVSLDAPIEYKRSMLEQWKNGGLIDIDILFSTGKPKQHSIGEIVKGYDTNPAVKELATDLMQVSGVGKGKGEFMLKVLSPAITHPPGGKGDIEVIKYGTVEVKTTDGGAGRFTDRQVKPGKGYQAAVNDFFETFKTYLKTENAAAETPPPVAPPATPAPTAPAAPENDTARLQQLAGIAPTTPVPTEPEVTEARKPKTPKTTTAKKMYSAAGINIDQLSQLYSSLPTDLRGVFTNKLTAVVDQVFVAAPEYSGAFVTALTTGTVAKAKQLYGVGILNNYMAQKTDKGILYINLRSNPPTFTFFTDNTSLNDAGMRLNIETTYPVTNDIQNAYPKTSIVTTGQAQPAAMVPPEVT